MFNYSKEHEDGIGFAGVQTYKQVRNYFVLSISQQFAFIYLSCCHRAALEIQCFRRRCRLRERRVEQRRQRAASSVQSMFRMNRERTEFLRKRKAAIKIASLARMFAQVNMYEQVSV